MNADEKIAALKSDLDRLYDIFAQNEDARKKSEDRLEQLLKRLVAEVGTLRVSGMG
jgi:hypothetical protein